MVHNNNDVRVVAAAHQLHHAVAIDPELHDGHQPVLVEDYQSFQEFPVQHHLGDMANRCPHCQTKYFQEECTTKHIFTKCCFQGKVS